MIADVVSRTILSLAVAGVVATFVHGSNALQDDPRAVGVWFGMRADSGELVQSSTLPLIPGQEFGWVLHTDRPGPVHWREELVAPSAPREWVGDMVVSADGRVAVTERTEEVDAEGTLQHSWVLTDGDPAGVYEMHIFVDNQLIDSYSFRVVDTKLVY